MKRHKIMCSSGVEVVLDDPKNNPRCPHGPTLLFQRGIKPHAERFFACSASRDRKVCPFYLLETERSKYKVDLWTRKGNDYVKGVHHRKKFLLLNEMERRVPMERVYCLNCTYFILKSDSHVGHSLLRGITDEQLRRPSEILPPLENSKIEAQYLFSKSSVNVIVDIFKSLNYRNVICIGAPRIHEHIRNSCPNMSSILLDIDKRFHDFFGPLEFCWYNLFNNHFFFKEAKKVFEGFLTTDNGKGTVLITDPPFGGRTEPIVYTLKLINVLYQKLNGLTEDLPTFWIFPYFMESYILNGLPEFKMLHYKVEYDNHPLFHDGLKGRKQGSPVRIFTNVNRLIKLPENNYKFCKKCNLWVSIENKHCDVCKCCPTKDGRTYIHCTVCEKCVKPTWKHCNNCNKCALSEHKCEIIPFTKECFLCKKTGHKRCDCPLLKVNERKRLKGQMPPKGKRRKIS